jgi:hypothetical protein
MSLMCRVPYIFGKKKISGLFIKEG